MDMHSAIERHRGPLLGLIMALFAEIGLTEGGMIERLPKPLYRKVLGILRVAESAVRRLIFAAARDIVLEPSPQGAARAKSGVSGKDKCGGPGGNKSRRGMAFRLFDPPRNVIRLLGGRREHVRVEPRIRVLDLGIDPRIPPFLRPRPAPARPGPAAGEDQAIEDDTVNAVHLCRRLFAIKNALEDLPGHAMRLARWRAKPVEQRRPRRESPLRTGRPPGWRQRPTHEVHEILKECHWLAHHLHPELDTS